MGEGCERCRTNPTHHLPRAGVATEIGAENHRIGQRTNKAFSPRTIAIGDVRGHAQVVLAQRSDCNSVFNAATSAMNNVPPSRWLKRLTASVRLAGNVHIPPRGAEVVDRRLATGLCRGSTSAADREAARASMRAAQRRPNATATAAARTQSPRTESRAAPMATRFRRRRPRRGRPVHRRARRATSRRR